MKDAEKQVGEEDGWRKRRKVRMRRRKRGRTEEKKE